MVSGAILSDIKLAASSSPRTQRAIAEKAVQVDYMPGIELYQQGDPPSPLHMLLTGRVKLYRQSRDRCQILALPANGDSIGAESLPTGGTSPYAATTLTQVRALVISTVDLQVLLDELPDFQEAFLRLITERLKQFVTLVHDLAFRDVTSRLAMVLVARAEVEGRPQDGGVLFDRLLSQQEYADVVGTAREVVYRTFKRFEDDGLVSMTRRHILIRDLDTLRLIGQQESR
ncbi:MAG: Crp/Fnr family transcriptional regulator [Chloroflexi bacterium]|nr:Crp/Fnr family transcriptional regulator [Chloroflexota bacterium]